MEDNYKQTKILKKSSVIPLTHPDRFYYLNLKNGILYELNPELVSDLKIEILDGTDELTSLEKLRKESMRIMEEYIGSECCNSTD